MGQRLDAVPPHVSTWRARTLPLFCSATGSRKTNLSTNDEGNSVHFSHFSIRTEHVVGCSAGPVSLKLITTGFSFTEVLQASEHGAVHRAGECDEIELHQNRLAIAAAGAFLSQQPRAGTADVLMTRLGFSPTSPTINGAYLLHNGVVSSPGMTSARCRDQHQGPCRPQVVGTGSALLSVHAGAPDLV